MMQTVNTQKNKALALLMALAMVVSLFAGLSGTASAASTDYTGQTEQGDYTIGTAAQLQTFADTVNAGNVYTGSTFTLTANIDLEGTEWTPITGFDGTFDGFGYSIQRYTISSTGNNIGLFGSAADNSVIKRLNVTEANVSGNSSVGAIVGRSFGTVDSCAVHASTVTSSGRSQGVGAVVGGSWESGVVSNLTATNVTVTGTYSTTYVGGVVGKIENEASNLKTVGTSTITSVDIGGSVIGYVAIGASYTDLSTEGTVTVNAVTSIGYVGFDANGLIPPIAGNTEISAGGSYTVSGNSAITITTGAPVTLVGDGSSYAVTVNCTVAANLTIDNLKVTSPSSTTTNIIDFQAGANTLTLVGENLLENDRVADSMAVIHVGPGVSLTIGGSGTLYLYKNAMGIGIGSNTDEANGAITIDSGNLFLKGARTGAVIGNDAGSAYDQSALGVITVNGGNLFVANTANGAGIGGSNQSKGGKVVVNNGNVTLATAFGGSAIGAGNGQKGNDGANGTLEVNGGSIKAMITSNAYDNWGITSGDPYVINNAAITAEIVDGAGDPAVLIIESVPEDLRLPVTAFVIPDYSVFYEGGLHEYYYAASTTSTAANFVRLTGENVDYNLYFYAPAGSEFYLTD